MDSSLFISIFSTIVALISAYISQFKKGRIIVPKVRAYKLDPLNFSVESESYRAVRCYIMLTFMNTGASSQAITDLRMRIPMPEKNDTLILQWENEYPSLNADYKEAQFASQATLAPYGSINRVYSFKSKTEAASGKMVMAMEEICGQDANKSYSSFIEARDAGDRWYTLRKIAFRHAGRMMLEDNFEKINKA